MARAVKLMACYRPHSSTIQARTWMASQMTPTPGRSERPAEVAAAVRAFTRSRI